MKNVSIDDIIKTELNDVEYSARPQAKSVLFDRLERRDSRRRIGFWLLLLFVTVSCIALYTYLVSGKHSAPQEQKLPIAVDESYNDFSGAVADKSNTYMYQKDTISYTDVSVDNSKGQKVIYLPSPITFSPIKTARPKLRMEPLPAKPYALSWSMPDQALKEVKLGVPVTSRKIVYQMPRTIEVDTIRMAMPNQTESKTLVTEVLELKKINVFRELRAVKNKILNGDPIVAKKKNN